MMKSLMIFPIAIFLLVACESAQLQESVGAILGGISKSGALSSQETSLGLKNALKNGAESAQSVLSKPDGFLKNQAVKILFPKEFQRAETTLRQMGLSSLADQVIVSFNRAAEKASSKAYPILANAITQMSFNDAMEILLGAQDQATAYLRKKTTQPLKAEFLPIVRKSADQVLATKYWKEMATTYNRIPLVKPIPQDISGYITEKTIAGLFHQVERQEREIRKNPGARTSEILKRVFSYADEKKK